MIKTKSKELLAELIQNSNSITLMGHRKGDGDSFGSVIGLKLALETLGKKVEVVAEDILPPYLDFLNKYFNFKFIENIPSDCDLLICLDWAELTLAAKQEEVEEFLSQGKKIAIIDHHQQGAFIDSVYISWSDSSYCSSAQMVQELVEYLGINIDKNMATAFLTGIETDTSSFQNQNTNHSCFAASARLMKDGARLNDINKGIASDRSIGLLKYWGEALDRLKYNKKYDIAITYLTYKDTERYGISLKSSMGLINFLNSIKGAKIVILMIEEEPGKIKMSFRTRDENVDVSKLARAFGGGGHVKAAAAVIPGEIKVTGGKIEIL